MKELRIISRDNLPFEGREEAGEQLAEELRMYKRQDPVVLGIPSGGMIVAETVAERLEAELDVVLSRKLGAPGNPELAIGAVSEDGKLFLDKAGMVQVDAKSVYLDSEYHRTLERINKEKERFRALRPRVSLTGRVVIVIDDGVATGSTMQAALWAVNRESPEKVVAALPVAPEETLEKLSSAASEIVCLKAPPDFGAVGQFYLVFPQIVPAELEAVLSRAAQRVEILHKKAA